MIWLILTIFIIASIFYSFGSLPSLDQMIDIIFISTIQLVQPVPVQGFLDDLIGQRMFVEVVLLILSISLFL